MESKLLPDYAGLTRRTSNLCSLGDWPQGIHELAATS